jgi:hypothetical protein
MPDYVGVIAFLALFFGVGAFIVIARGNQRKLWARRPELLRSLAGRRGFQFVEKPGKPSELAPIRPTETQGNVTRLELPAAVRGRVLDSQFTMFDIYTETVSRAGSRTTHVDSYETFITIKSDSRWPHFEFAAVSNAKVDSLEGKLLGMVGNLAEALMQQRKLTHVPIPGHPGFQLFAGDAATGPALSDALVQMFESNTGWWVGALDDALTISKKVGRSATMSSLVPEADLDRFIDEALQIERDLRRRLATRR